MRFEGILDHVTAVLPNLLFLLYHLHEESIYAFHQVPKILTTQSLYFSNITM